MWLANDVLNMQVTLGRKKVSAPLHGLGVAWGQEEMEQEEGAEQSSGSQAAPENIKERRKVGKGARGK